VPIGVGTPRRFTGAAEVGLIASHVRAWATNVGLSVRLVHFLDLSRSCGNIRARTSSSAQAVISAKASAGAKSRGRVCPGFLADRMSAIRAHDVHQSIQKITSRLTIAQTTTAFTTRCMRKKCTPTPPAPLAEVTSE
jgi:hypothetical protein